MVTEYDNFPSVDIWGYFLFILLFLISASVTIKKTKQKKKGKKLVLAASRKPRLL